MTPDILSRCWYCVDLDLVRFAAGSLYSITSRILAPFFCLLLSSRPLFQFQIGFWGLSFSKILGSE